MKQTVLIIGSNHQRALYSGLLTGYGYHVAEAHTADDGYSLLAAGLQPSAVILDLSLADLPDIILALRAIGGDTVNIIVIGGDSAADSFTRNRGANRFLHKPVQAEAVLNAVQMPIAS
jgi:DNA-binding NtrC family response regulator